jgi:serine/threonine protein kinase
MLFFLCLLILYLFSEVLNKEQCNEKIDWWSSGALYFYCIMGKRLFDGTNKSEIISDILHCDIWKRLNQCPEERMPNDLKHLINNMLSRDIGRRYNATQIKEHPFFTGSTIHHSLIKNST